MRPSPVQVPARDEHFLPVLGVRAATERLKFWLATVGPVTLASLACSVNAVGAQAARTDRCAALTGERLPLAGTIVAQSIPAGRFDAPDGAPYQVPAFCRVRGELNSGAGSRIAFELWLPSSGWNGRYYQLGTGGFAGNISSSSLAAALRAGNAAAMTDTGHRGDAFDASWARGFPERVVDYGHRSVQATALAAGPLIRAYYGTPARYRYFAGCSNGGRQALMGAQRYPQLWDGILAGAPAYDWTRQLASFAWLQHTLRSDRNHWIGTEKLPTIQRAAVASCAAAARVVDGVPGDPRFCPFEPRTLLCKGVENNECLTAAQVESLETIQNGPRSPVSNQRLFFGFEPTSAAVADNWQRWIVNANPDANSQLTFAEQFYRNLVFSTAGWTIKDFDGGRDFTLAREKSIRGAPLTDLLDATSTDLTALERHGGKLLMYFGWADAVLAPRAGVDYYERVSRRLGGLTRTESFFRLFMVPGMTHCQGGPAPDAFGQSALSPALSDDAQHDIRRALEAWVEQGIAPKSLVAAKYGGDDTRQPVEATQLLCPFPQRAAVSSSGDPRRASNYVCVDP